eukprot:6568074-Prymnesium_polylepis.1
MLVVIWRMAPPASAALRAISCAPPRNSPLLDRSAMVMMPDFMPSAADCRSNRACHLSYIFALPSLCGCMRVH